MLVEIWQKCDAMSRHQSCHMDPGMMTLDGSLSPAATCIPAEKEMSHGGSLSSELLILGATESINPLVRENGGADV